MLSLRIWAVWNRKPTITVIILVAMAGCLIPASVFYNSFVKGFQCKILWKIVFSWSAINKALSDFLVPSPTPVPGVSGFGECFYLISNKDIIMCWILLMIYDASTSLYTMDVLSL